MWVTIYTDASYRPMGDQRGGWAVWIRSELGRIVKAGPCPDYICGSLEAEVCAIYCGLHLAVKAWPEATAFLVRTDCQGACFDPRSRRYADDDNAALARFCRLMSETLGRRILRHKWVKGHQKNNSMQAYLNRQCDLLSGRVTGKHS